MNIASLWPRVILTTCWFFLRLDVTPCAADDAKPPRINVVSLEEFDVSHEISGSPRAVGRPLKPRITPGYDDLRDAVWMGGTNTVAAMLSIGADPNATSKDVQNIVNMSVPDFQLGKRSTRIGGVNAVKLQSRQNLHGLGTIVRPASHGRNRPDTTNLIGQTP